MLQSHVGIAKEKLCQLVAEADGRHDSGCDFDGSSSASQDDPASVGTEHSGSDKQSGNKSPDVVIASPRGSKQNSPVKKKKKASPKKSCGTSTANMTTEAAEEEEVTVIDLEDGTGVDKTNAGLELPGAARSDVEAHNLRRRRLRDRPSSARSHTGSTASQFEELRKCIATELHQAHHLSSNLRDAIAQDLGSCRQRPFYYDMARTEGEILSSLSKSYHLRGDEDEHSVSSSVFTYDNPVFSRDQQSRRSNCSRRTSRTSRQSSFRSVASIALEIAESYSRKDRGGSAKERELQWPSYIPPKEASVRSAGPPRVVRSSEAPVVYTRNLYNTYV